MSTRVFLFLAFLTVLVIDAFPLYQALTCEGRLYYVNAYDEAYYLQYDFSQENERLSRPGQYLVTLAHEAGLSGGWINLVFDTFFVTAFLFLVRALFKSAGYDDRRSNMASILMTLGPLLFLGSNPVVRILFDKSLAHGFVSWLAVPEAPYLPIVRSPEPQFSILLAGLGSFFALKRRRLIYAFLCVPFLYSFIALPLAFVLLALYLRDRSGWLEKRPVLCLAASFLAVALAQAIYFGFLVPDWIRQVLLVPSRAPCLSFTFVGAFAGYLVFRREIPARSRFLLLAVVFAPLAAENGQLVTGRYVDANNVEQNFGVYAVALVLTWAVLQSTRLERSAWALVGVSVLLLLHSSEIYFEINYSTQRRLPLDGDLLAQLRADSPHVAINDVALASLASMVFPRQPMTLLSFAQTSPPVAKEDLERYLCAKWQILGDATRRPHFETALRQIDKGYRHESSDFVLISGGRRTTYPVEHDMGAVPVDCRPMALHYVLSR
jgi:hypothetical protein